MIKEGVKSKWDNKLQSFMQFDPPLKQQMATLQDLTNLLWLHQKVSGRNSITITSALINLLIIINTKEESGLTIIVFGS